MLSYGGVQSDVGLKAVVSDSLRGGQGERDHWVG